MSTYPEYVVLLEYVLCTQTLGPWVTRWHPWRISACDMTYVCVWHDSFLHAILLHTTRALSLGVTHGHPGLIHTCDMTHCCVWQDSFLSVILLIYLLFVTHVARFLMTCDLWKNKETYLYTMHGYGIQTELCTHECMGDTSYEKYWWVIDRVFVSHLTCDVWTKKRNISICRMYVYTQTYVRDTSYEK